MNPLALVRALSALLALRLLGRFVRGVAEGMRDDAPAPPPASTGTEMVRDLVCNTFVPRERALRATVGGREAYFCSAECRARAQAALMAGGAAVPPLPRA
jgi:YHS domain-containing protein